MLREHTNRWQVFQAVGAINLHYYVFISPCFSDFYESMNMSQNLVKGGRYQDITCSNGTERFKERQIHKKNLLKSDSYYNVTL